MVFELFFYYRGQDIFFPSNSRSKKTTFCLKTAKLKKSLKNQQQVATIRPLDSFTWIIVWSAWSSQSFERHLRGIASKERAKSEIGPKIKILKPC